MDKFISKLAKLTAELGPDDIWGDAFIARPSTELITKLGTVFGWLQLDSLPEQFNEQFLEIIEDLKTEYYLPPLETEYGVEKRFEECLQRANRRIHKIINQSIDEVELDQISSVIALIHKDKLYLSQIGTTNAFLFHQKKKHDHLILDIIKQTGDKKKVKTNPEKMFSNIISGELTVKDSLIICNSPILEFLSPNELKDIVTENTSLTAVKELEKILTSQTGQGNFYAIIIQPEEELEPETSPTAPVRTNLRPEASLNNLLNTQEKTEQYLTPSLMPSWQKAIIIILRGLKKLLQLVIKYLKISGIYLLKQLKRLISQIRQESPSAIASEEQTPQTNIQAEIAHDSQQFKQFTDNISQKSLDIAKKVADKAKNLDEYKKLLPLDKNKTIGQNLSDWLNTQLARFFNLKRYQQILVIMAMIVIFFFCQSIVWQGRNQTTVETTDLNDIISQIDEKINTAEAQNIFNDEAGARASISEAVALLNQVPDKRKYQETRLEFQSRIDTVNQLLQKMTFLDQPEVIADLTKQNSQADTAGLAFANNQLFSFDNNNHTLYQIDLDNQQSKKFELASSISDITKAKAIDDNQILLLNGNKEFYLFKPTDNKAEVVLTLDQAIADFGLYGDKIYTLRTNQNQVYKHLKSSTGYNQGSAWIGDGTDVKQATAITVDGGIYLAYADGQLKYLMGGGLDTETTFTDISPDISNPVDIHSHIESNYIYVLDPDNQRVVVFDKNGKLKIQYTSNQFSNIKAMAVAENNKQIYILADNKIYGIEINF